MAKFIIPQTINHHQLKNLFNSWKIHWKSLHSFYSFFFSFFSLRATFTSVIKIPIRLPLFYFVWRKLSFLQCLLWNLFFSIYRTSSVKDFFLLFSDTKNWVNSNCRIFLFLDSSFLLFLSAEDAHFLHFFIYFIFSVILTLYTEVPAKTITFAHLLKLCFVHSPFFIINYFKE